MVLPLYRRSVVVLSKAANSIVPLFGVVLMNMAYGVIFDRWEGPASRVIMEDAVRAVAAGATYDADWRTMGG